MPFHPLSLRIWRLAACVLAIVAVCFISVAPQIANDFWLQAKVGELIVGSHAIPQTLLFPFTDIQTAKFNAHEWLPSALFYGMIQLVGEDGLPMVLGALGLVLFGLVTWLAFRRSPSSFPLALVLGLVAISVENFRHFLRPELISLILLVAYLHLLESLRRNPSAKYWGSIAAVVVLWSNTHGSFILAPLIAGIFCVGTWLDSRRAPVQAACAATTTATPFAVLTLVVLACTAVNPFGLDQLAFVVSFTGSEFASGFVLEWISSLDPIAWKWRGFWIGLVCTAVTVAVCIKQRKKLSAVDALLLLFFILLAVRSARFIVYLGIISAYILPPLVPSRALSLAHAPKLYGASIVIAATILALAAMFGNAYGSYPHQSNLNQSFTKPMRNALGNPAMKGNVLTSYDYGAELVYRAYPRLRPSLDSRIDSYGTDYVMFTEQLLENEQVLATFLSQYNVQYMLLTLGDFDLIRKLPSVSHWTVVLKDNRAILLSRN